VLFAEADSSEKLDIRLGQMSEVISGCFLISCFTNWNFINKSIFPHFQRLQAVTNKTSL